jgi:YVTN family beta-propeller protein
MRIIRAFVLLFVLTFLLSIVILVFPATRYNSTNSSFISPVSTPIIPKESNISSNFVSQQSSYYHWWDIDYWANSADQLPPKMNGTFTAVLNNISGLASADAILYLPLNVAYGTSSNNCVWFQFDIQFTSGGSTLWAIWDNLEPASNASCYDYQYVGIPYIVGDEYNFELATSGTNTVTFSIKDITSGASWSTSSWKWTVPSLTMLYDASWFFSPASAVEGYTTNLQLGNVTYFQTYVGYNLQTHWHRGDVYSPSGIGTQVSGGPGFYYWSMFSPSPTVKVSATGLSEPWGVALTPDGAYAYVTDYASDSVSVINTATNHVTETIAVGGSPTGVAITPDGAYAYVTNPGSNSVSVISTATNNVTSTITVGAKPFGVAITPNGRHVYVTHGVFSDLVSEISTVTNTVEARILVDWDCFGLAVSPDGTHTYVTCYSGLVYVLNAANTVTATISGLYALRDVAFTPNGAYAYVTDSGNGLGNGTVSVINTATNMVTANVTGISEPSDIESVVVSPNGAYVYATNSASDTISVINTASNTVTAIIPVKGNPVGVAITPNGAYVYATSSNAPGSVSVISTATNTVTATLRGIAAAGPLTMDIGQCQLFTATPWDGSGAIHYQWYVDAGAVGTDSSTYSYTASGSYSSVTCKVTDSASPPRTSPASNAVSITVNPALTVSVTPTSFTMDVGQSLIFTCAASGGTGTLSYQWYLAGSAVSGETSTSYIFTASSANSPTIYCKVTDEASSPLTVQSNIPSVTVNPTLAAPTVTPTLATVGQGQTSSLTSTAVTTGTSPYSYQWLIEVPGGSSFSAISAATLSSYNFVTGSSTATGLWSFELKVTDATGAFVTSNGTTVTVNPALSVTVSPSPVVMNNGQTQTFTATPSGGSGTYTGYQWYVNGSTQNGQTSSTFSLTSGSLGSYLVSVTVTDSSGVTSSQSTAVAATTSVSSTPTPTNQPTPNPTANPTQNPNPTAPATLTSSPTKSANPSPSSTPSIPEYPLEIVLAFLTICVFLALTMNKNQRLRIKTDKKDKEEQKVAQKTN